jgi:hypothetical protein
MTQGEDPYIHADKTVTAWLGGARVREAFARAPGLQAAVGTGCGERRPAAMASGDPSEVTCLPCREWAAAQYEGAARRADTVLELAGGPGELARFDLTADEVRRHSREYREIAARYRALP